MKTLIRLSLLLPLLAMLLFASCDSPEDKKGRFLLKGNEKLMENDTKAAVDFYSEALKIDPDYIDALYNRGLVYQRLNRLEDAIADYGKVLVNDPVHQNSLFQRGLALLDNGEYYKALVDAETLINLSR